MECLPAIEMCSFPPVLQKAGCCIAHVISIVNDARDYQLAIEMLLNGFFKMCTDVGSSIGDVHKQVNNFHFGCIYRIF